MGASLDGTAESSGAGLADEQAWASTLLDYMNGKDGALGGPTFTGAQQGISGSWWLAGSEAGQYPDGIQSAWGQRQLPSGAAGHHGPVAVSSQKPAKSRSPLHRRLTTRWYSPHRLPQLLIQAAISGQSTAVHRSRSTGWPIPPLRMLSSWPT